MYRSESPQQQQLLLLLLQKTRALSAELLTEILKYISQKKFFFFKIVYLNFHNFDHG
jgi:hypothetical protein